MALVLARQLSPIGGGAVTRSTRYERFVERLQDHRWAAPLMVAGLILTVIGSATDALGRLVGRVRPAPELELIAAEELRPRILDVTIRNLSSNDAVITRIHAQVDSIVSDCFAKPLPSSADYIVPLRYKERATGDLAIRHVIPAHGVDRFTIGLRTDAVCMGTSFILEYSRGRELRFSHSY